MAIFVPWLADAARMTGYPVVEEAGWRSRGAKGLGMSVVEGVVGHHTAGPKTGEYPCRNMILNGHSTLPGPLANFGLGRSGTIYVVAAGRANHAGTSYWAGYSNLNDKFLGIEAEDDGDGIWTKEQIDCYPRLVAALLHYMRRSPSRYAGHKDIAPDRKIDPRGLDSAWFRNKATEYLATPDTINRYYKTPVVNPDTGEEETVLRAIFNVDNKSIALVGPGYFKHVTPAQWDAALAAGICNAQPDDVNTAQWDQLKFAVLTTDRL